MDSPAYSASRSRVLWGGDWNTGWVIVVENSCSSSTVVWNRLLGESGITGVASVRTTVGTSVIAVSTSRPNSQNMSREVFTVLHKIWSVLTSSVQFCSDSAQNFEIKLPAICSQMAWNFSDQNCSELTEPVSSVRSKSNQILSRIWSEISNNGYIFNQILTRFRADSEQNQVTLADLPFKVINHLTWPLSNKE